MNMIKVKVVKDILVKHGTTKKDKEIFVNEMEYHLFKKLGFIKDIEQEKEAIKDISDEEVESIKEKAKIEKKAPKTTKKKAK